MSEPVKDSIAGQIAGRITGSELEVMKLLWRLVGKGALRQEKRNVYYYSPLIGEQEYNAWATDDLIHRLYNGSARDLVAALVHSDGLTKQDLEELQNMFIVED